MKRVKYLGLLLGAMTFLAACQPADLQSTTTETETSTQTSAPTESEEILVGSSEQEAGSSAQQGFSLPVIYQDVIGNYQASLAQPEAINPEQVSTQLVLVHQPEIYAGAFYSLYDFNQDGVEDLIIALKKSDSYVLIDLYTLYGGGDLLRLVDSFRHIGPEIGEEAILRPLQDGSYLYEVAGQSKFYQYDEHIPGLGPVPEIEAESPVFDLNSLTWIQIEAQ